MYTYVLWSECWNASKSVLDVGLCCVELSSVGESELHCNSKVMNMGSGNVPGYLTCTAWAHRHGHRPLGSGELTELQWISFSMFTPPPCSVCIVSLITKISLQGKLLSLHAKDALWKIWCNIVDAEKTSLQHAQMLRAMQAVWTILHRCSERCMHLPFLDTASEQFWQLHIFSHLASAHFQSSFDICILLCIWRKLGHACNSLLSLLPANFETLRSKYFEFWVFSRVHSVAN